MPLWLLKFIDLARAAGKAVWSLACVPLSLPLGVLVAPVLALLLLSYCHGREQFKVGYAQGEAHERAEWQKVAAKVREIRKRLGDRLASIGADENRRLGRQLADNHAHFTNLRKGVRTHVTPAADARCVVPVGFVRQLNKGIAGPGRRPPDADAAGRPDEAAAGLALSDVADQLLGGFEVPYGWRAENDRWRSWYPRVCAEWRKAGGLCELSP